MASDPLDLFRLLTGGDLVASVDKPLGRPDAQTPIEWDQTPFRELELIGRGGMGAVFSAYDGQAGRRVALKLLLNQSPAARERFAREGRLAASLNHSNVVQVHDLLEFPKGQVLVCELLSEARALDQAWRGQPLAERIRLLHQASQGVAAAHQLGVVHRDLKPENILVDAAGRARIADFGIAYGEDLERLTQSGTTLGTPAFMAPEQLGVSRGAAPTASADLWSLGVILYLALTDELPFAGDSLLEIAGALSQGFGARHARALAGAPRPLHELVRDCLQPDPALRPQSAEVFASRLAAWLEDPAPGPKRGALRALIGVAALGLALGALWLARSGGPARPADSPPSASPSVAEATPTPSPQDTRRRDAIARAIQALESGAGLGKVDAELQELRALSRELPLEARGVLEGQVLEAVAREILASKRFDGIAAQTLTTLADTGARLEPSTGIGLVELYLTDQNFGRYAVHEQQDRFLLLIRLDAPTACLSITQFSQAFGARGPPRGPSPWARFARLRSSIHAARSREALLELLRLPDSEVPGPTQRGEVLAELVGLASEEGRAALLPEVQAALELNPNCPAALRALARAHAARGDAEAALGAFERMLVTLRAQSYPDLKSTRNYCGKRLHDAALAFAKAGDLDRARELVVEGASYPPSANRAKLLGDFPQLLER